MSQPRRARVRTAVAADDVEVRRRLGWPVGAGPSGTATTSCDGIVHRCRACRCSPTGVSCCRSASTTRSMNSHARRRPGTSCEARSGLRGDLMHHGCAVARYGSCCPGPDRRSATGGGGGRRSGRRSAARGAGAAGVRKLCVSDQGPAIVPFESRRRARRAACSTAVPASARSSARRCCARRPAG